MPKEENARDLQLLYPHLSAVQFLFLFFLAVLARLAVRFDLDLIIVFLGVLGVLAANFGS